MMDRIRQRAQSLLEKLHDKYGIEPKQPIHLLLAAAVCRKEGDDPGLQDHWYLVDAHGQKFRLPKTMLFLGREECDVVVASQSVDKRHAVLTFDLYLNRFKVKDLSTTNGTYVNNSRIQEQEYVTLNHMDSVRLGHDAMMYHVEQGSQITGQGGQLPDPSFVPAWASRHQPNQPPCQQQQHPQHVPFQGEPINVHAHAMAECQGCIAEQNIEHSCSLQHDAGLHDDHVMVSKSSSPSSSSHHHPHHDYHQHQQTMLPNKQPQPTSSSPSSSSSAVPASHQTKSSPSFSNTDQSHDHHSLSQNSRGAHCSNNSNSKNNRYSEEPSLAQGLDRSLQRRTSDPQDLGDQNSSSPISSKNVHCSPDANDHLDGDNVDKADSTTQDAPQAKSCGPGRNTWPRKRVKPAMPHISNLFTPEDGEHQHQGSEAKPAGRIGEMYFVSFDDSICNGGDAGSAPIKESKRRPRNSQGPLPAELTTVKKGTPLYGQPSWWGEEEEEEQRKGEKKTKSSKPVGPSGDDPGSRHRQTKLDGAGSTGRRSRPNSLTLSGDEADHFPVSASTTYGKSAVGNRAETGAIGQSRMNGERIKPTYMEIPFGDDDEDFSTSLETTAPGSGKKAAVADSSASTPAKSISSSLSKDSLLDSPDTRKAPASKSSGETATSFTVDLSDPADPQHKATKAVTMTASLSQYMPSKIRRNFKDRQERAGSYTKTGSSSRGSTPSKASEERELSPVHNPSTSQQPGSQRKMEEIWSAMDSSGKPAKQAARLSSVQATAGSKPSSLRSPNLEDIDRISGEDGKLMGQKTSSLSPHVPRSSRSKISPASSSGGAAKNTTAGLVSAVAQYPDSTSYLIDKMFEGGNSSGFGGSTAGSTASCDSTLSPEKQLYKEAAANDRTRRSTSSGGISATAGKQSSKPPRIYSGKTSAAPAMSAAVGGGKRTSSSSEEKPAVQSKSACTSAAPKAKSIRGSSSVAASAAKPHGKRQQRSSSAVVPSPPKICDKNIDDSDDDNDNFMEDDDLQITEEEEEVMVKSSQNPLEDGEVSDKASEAGTYVIEAGADGEDVEDEEEEEARRKIDEVFGVDKGPDSLRLASPGGYDNVCDEDAFDNDETVGEEDDCDGDGDRTPLEGHSPLSEDEDALEDPTMATKNGVQTWMSQLNALTSNHQQPSLSADDRQMAKEDGESSLSRKPPQGGNKRPGTGRKLPSIPTDRSPVSSEHSSTCILDPESAQVVDGQAGWSAASSQRLLNGGHKTNGLAGVGVGVKGKSVFDSTASSRNKAVKNGGVANGNHGISRHVSSSSPGSARSRGSVDTELLLQDTETVMAAMEARMAYRTAGHQGSTDSERNLREDGEFDSDTDVSSTAALVNGDEDYVKPSYFTSPRDALSRTISNTNDSRRPVSGKLARDSGMTGTASASQSGKRPVGRSYSQTVASKSRTPTSSVVSPRTPGSSVSALHRRSIGSDIYNGRDSVGADSLASDLGSESGTADGSLSRSSSRGKGTITMTKPNRAFQLRRARSDSVEETAAPTTPRSAKSGASARTSGSSARSSSVHSTNRNRSVVETNRSDATSLGAQIARKSRSNGAVMQNDVRASAAVPSSQKTSSSTALNRQDGGRHSLRLTRASSLTISSPSQSTAGSYPKKDSTHASSSINNSKSYNNSTPTGSRGNLTITGVGTTSSRDVGSSRSNSQPGSRSFSPKAAERIAWRRRKEYDPRKAVAEAKAAKAKESSGGHHSTATVTMRPKPHANSRVNRRMIRSASFTNTVGSLALSLAGSVSASQELVSGLPSASDYGGDSLGSGSSAYRRAFLPFQAVSGRSGGHRSAHSADEDDSLLGSTRATPTITTTNCCSPAGSHLSVATPEPKSAFTPPPLTLHQQHSARQRSPSSSRGRSRSSTGFSRIGSLSLLRRRSLQGETGGSLPLSLPRSSVDFGDDYVSLTNGVGHDESIRSRRHLETPPAQTSYDTLIVSSIYQLSMKLLGNTNKSLQKLRDQSRASHSPSPCDDFLNDGTGGGRGEMTAFRSANQELAGVLNNLRRLERHVQVMNSVLFPEDEVPTRVSAGSLPSPSTPSTGVGPSCTASLGGGRQGKQRYFAEIERIRSELAGFHPIGGAQIATVADNASSEADSPEMAELSEQF